MAWLLRPGGTLTVVAMARRRLPADLSWEIAAVVTHHRLHRPTKSDWRHLAPTVWPPPHTYPQIRRLAEQLLPAVRYRRRLLCLLPDLDQATPLNPPARSPGTRDDQPAGSDTT